jgi:hypothetical protein
MQYVGVRPLKRAMQRTAIAGEPRCLVLNDHAGLQHDSSTMAIPRRASSRKIRRWRRIAGTTAGRGPVFMARVHMSHRRGGKFDALHGLMARDIDAWRWLAGTSPRRVLELVRETRPVPIPCPYPC